MMTPIISITGTKGKTTATYIISEALRALGKNVLRVDTTGHFVNNERRSTLKQSALIWGLVPSVAPGRFLYEFIENSALAHDGVAVLECSLGSSTLPGLGYAHHAVGVFLNVYEDHLGSSDRLQTREDILAAKQFIFQRMRRDGWAVFNADDELVVKGTAVIPGHLNVHLLPFGRDLKYFDVKKHLASGGAIVTVESGAIVLKSREATTEIVRLDQLPWTFQGVFTPSVYNALAAAAAIIGYHDGVIPAGLVDALRAIRFDPSLGRLTLLKSTKGVTILADYAHEKVSLREIGKLAHSMAGPGCSVIGVIRLAFDRTDELIRDTGTHIAKDYDRFIVYDKIDGYLRQPKTSTHDKKFPEEIVGHVSKVLTDAIASHNPRVERILREDKALERAAELANPGDVVVHIVNDDIDRSLNFIRKAFNAELV